MQPTHPLAAEQVFSTGIYNIDLDCYLADRSYISSSGLKRILRSPLELQRYFQRQQLSSPILDFGTAVHCALLEPERFAQEYIALPVNHVDLFHAQDMELIQQQGKIQHFITQAQMDAVHGICEQVQQQPEIADLLAQGQAEQSLFWRDSESGIRCKIRPDLLRLPHLIVELKTTFNAALDVFQRTVLMQQYHLSAAMYLQGVQHITGHTPNYVFIVACREAPYQVSTFVPSAAMLQEGEKLFRLALSKLKAEKNISADFL